jgi:hypothetical protein
MIALPIGWMKFLSSKGLKRTTWEHGRNTSAIHEKKNLSPLPLAPKTQIKKLGRLSGCYTFPLAACNFYFQNC